MTETFVRKSESMTDEEADRLRSLVPDHPIWLPSDHLACEACGIAVPVSPEPILEPLPLVVGDLVLPKPQRFARATRAPPSTTRPTPTSLLTSFLLAGSAM